MVHEGSDNFGERASNGSARSTHPRQFRRVSASCAQLPELSTGERNRPPRCRPSTHRGRMTTPLPLSVPATNVPHTHVRRQDLSELIAGIPHVLGTPPRDSLVLYTFGGTESIRLATTLIGKLPPPTSVSSLAARALTAARLIGATAVIAVVVGGDEVPTPSNPLPHRTLVETLRYTFESEGIVLVHASWVNKASPGEPWRCYDDITCHDTVPDAVTATLTAAASVAGVGAFSTREDLAALLAPDGKYELAERSALLDEQLKKPSAPYTADELTADLELIKQTIDRARETRQLPTFTDVELVRLASAIAQAEIRDECLMIALGPGSDAAERVWLALVRALPAPERAEAAFLLAMSTFLRGEVVVAALALESALEANPGHVLAPLLTTNLTNGTSPTQLRSMLVESVIRAAELRAARATDDDPPWETTPVRPADPDGTTPVTPPRPTEPHPDPTPQEGEEPPNSLTPQDTPKSAPECPDIAGLFLPMPSTRPDSSATSPPEPPTDSPNTPPPPAPRTPTPDRDLNRASQSTAPASKPGAAAPRPGPAGTGFSATPPDSAPGTPAPDRDVDRASQYAASTSKPGAASPGPGPAEAGSSDAPTHPAPRTPVPDRDLNRASRFAEPASGSDAASTGADSPRADSAAPPTHPGATAPSIPDVAGLPEGLVSVPSKTKPASPLADLASTPAHPGVAKPEISDVTALPRPADSANPSTAFSAPDPSDAPTSFDTPAASPIPDAGQESTALNPTVDHATTPPQPPPLRAVPEVPDIAASWSASQHRAGFAVTVRRDPG